VIARVFRYPHSIFEHVEKKRMHLADAVSKILSQVSSTSMTSCQMRKSDKNSRKANFRNAGYRHILDTILTSYLERTRHAYNFS